MSLNLKRYRRQRGWTQQALARVLRVTSNTVARWERGEVPMPAWVSALVESWGDATAQTQAAIDRARAVDAQIAALHVANAEQVQALNATFARLERENLLLRIELAGRRRRGPSAAVGSPALKAEQVFKRLVRKYHPDRHPESADVMADINELYQAMRESKRARRK